MQATIDLPDSIFEALQARAVQKGASIQTLILQAIEKEIGRAVLQPAKSRRVQSPLIQSRQPGSLHSLTNAEIDALLD